MRADRTAQSAQGLDSASPISEKLLAMSLESNCVPSWRSTWVLEMMPRMRTGAVALARSMTIK